MLRFMIPLLGLAMLGGCERKEPSASPPAKQTAPGPFAGLEPGMDKSEVEDLIATNGWATGPLNTIPLLGPGNKRTGLLTLFGNKVVNADHYLLVRYGRIGQTRYVLADHAFTNQPPKSQKQMMDLVAAEER